MTELRRQLCVAGVERKWNEKDVRMAPFATTTRTEHLTLECITNSFFVRGFV